MTRTWIRRRSKHGLDGIPYNIPNLRVENGKARERTFDRVAAFGRPYLSCICNSNFTDELATASGRDHGDYLLEMIGDPRIVSYKDMQNVPDTRSIPHVCVA